MESAYDIQDKLTQYRSQLQQVDQLLQLDPSNSQFVSLKDDLEKVISLTETLLQQVQTAEEAAVSQHQGDAAAHDHDAASGDDEPNADGVDNFEGEADLLPTIAKPLEVGDHVEVSGGDRLYAGVVTAVVVPEAEYKVRYYEFDAEVTLPSSVLHLLPPGGFQSAEDVAIGLVCMCRYSADRVYYDASVTEIMPHKGFRVTFVEYGNSEVVPLEYLRPKVVPVSSTKEAAGKTNADSGSAGGKLALIPIPENLKILPTDTEDEKKRKQKKLKGIKNRNRSIEQELAVSNVQSQWQSFVHKKNKRPAGAGGRNDDDEDEDADRHEVKRPKVGGKSMFSSSNAASSKVGVVNSGKGMTQYGERKRFSFDHLRQQRGHEDD